MIDWRGNQEFRMRENLALLLVSTSLSVYSAELVARHSINFFGDSSEVRYLKRDDIIKGLALGRADSQSRQRRNTGDYDVMITFNSIGLRDSKDVRLATSKSLLAVGDSFTFGHGVKQNQRFSNILSNKYSYDTYNVAIPGGLSRYSALIAYVDKLGGNTSNIILGICMENDLLLADSHKGSSANTKKQRNSPFIRAKSWLTRNSALYFVITSSLNSNQHARYFLENVGLIKKNMDTMQLKEYDLRSSALKVREIVRGRNALVVIIPSRYIWSNNPRMRAASREIHQSFTVRLKNHGLRIVDLAKHFNSKSLDPVSDFHFKYDGHWNAKGHAEAADAIAAALRIN